MRPLCYNALSIKAEQAHLCFDTVFITLRRIWSGVTLLQDRLDKVSELEHCDTMIMSLSDHLMLESAKKHVPIYHYLHIKRQCIQCIEQTIVTDRRAD